MKQTDPAETAIASAYASRSWKVVCLFVSGIFFGSFVSGMLLRWKPLLSSKFRALLGYQDESGSRLSQEHSACDHPPLESTSIMTEGSSSSRRGYKYYDVYVSFRGVDNSRSFIDYLNRRLLEEGILPFRDEVDLHRGEIISSALLQAIKDSRISIVVFSGGSASSTWWLDDLVAIADCHKEMKQEVVPVFYDVEPHEVRYQIGAYEDAFYEHRERFKEEPDKILKWKSAMKYLADLSGLTLRDLTKPEGIERIVEAVSDTLVYKFQRSRSTHKNPESSQRRPSLQEVKIYDVFLSLRPIHTHSTFIHYLHRYLTKNGFSTFMSDAEIQKGESISLPILQAIKDSRVFIVVFTRDSADSTCSLEEMATIVDCHRELNQTVIPVFYGVDPWDVERQTGPYEKAFISYTEEFKQDPHKVQRWREALKHMASLSGFELGNGPDNEMILIEKIIKRVEQLCPKSSRLSSQVGIQSSLATLEKRLKLKDDCVLVLGIWGMGGSGKTSHALALYDRIVQQFQGACFIEDVSRVYKVGGATALQKILRESLEEEFSDIEISGSLERMLCRKKILIVLDNVDGSRQLELLAINRNMLGMGSRIIITTRDRHVLDAYRADEIYQVPRLNDAEARELFLSACPGVTNYKGCNELIPRVLAYAGGLPLAIRVLGSFLQHRDVTNTLDRLRRVPSFEIIKILQTSFDGLDQQEREIFLHIACFFCGKKVDFVMEVLNCCGFFAEMGIQVLMDKSLINVENEEEEIHMHHLLQEMGKGIVCQECPENPESQSRLWLKEDFSSALKSKKEASKVKAIVLYEDTSISKHKYLNIQGLSKMRNLRLLILYDQHFSGKLTSLPKRLQYLLWDRYPLSSLPSFEPYNSLVQLNLPNSHIKRLWNGCQNFPNLERLDLSYSKELMETPNFEGSPSLKRLDFTGCTNLVQVDSSIGLLKELAYLSFHNCCRLVILDLDAGCNYDCKKLETKSDFPGLGLLNLEHLDLGECTSLSTVHYSIGILKLKFLNLEGCINLVEKPDFSVSPRDGPEIEATKNITQTVEGSTDENPESPQRRPSSQEVNKYDVFLSLRRTHTAYTFIDHLYQYLNKRGFSTFKSDQGIERGESILFQSKSQLLQAIKNSQILIVVFTSDYADSTICLEEMATIVDCHRELKQTAFPVFYDVVPRDVRRQTGPYEKAFTSYAEEFKQDPHKVQRWREALNYMASLSGFVLGDGPEIEAIGNIVQTVERLCPKFSRLSSNSQVGIQSSLATLEKRLKLKDDCVLVLGIWGIGGSGKTNHALALYDRIVQQFQGACFIEDVSRVYKVGGATALQKILRESLEEELSDTYTPFEISGSLERMLCRKKTLIVLDNVDGPRQLELLAINRNMLGMGSRIIITTRHKHVLDAYRVDDIYEIPRLNDAEARELFLSACPGVTSYEGCTELIPRVLEYAGGLPLVIKVLGSFLQYHSVSFWQSTLDRLRRVPSYEIMKTLQISFDGLDDQEKEIFLHIACFFHGKKVDFVKEVLSFCGYFAEFGIQVLIDKSLITRENEEEEIHMHHLLQDMGKEIVRQECPRNPALRSRLWYYKDISFALDSSEMEASQVKAIVLYKDTSISKHKYLNIQGLSKMGNLRLLILHYQHFSGKLTSLPQRLQYLLWDEYPFSSLPSFEQYNSLVQLNLPNSRIQRLWSGRQNFPSLEGVDLSYSKELKETPDFGGSPRLRELYFTGCTNLVRVHPSIGLLKELVDLSFRNCCRLVILDLDHECKLSSLRFLDLYSCTNLKTAPDFTGLPNLEYIDLRECVSLSTVHHSIWNLKKFKFLKVPASINLPMLHDVAIIRTPEVLSHGEKVKSSSYIVIPLRGLPGKHIKT